MAHHHLSVFDLDHTLLSTNASFEFGRYLYRKGVFSFPRMVCLVATYLLHKTGVLSLLGLHQAIFQQLFLGRPSAQILRHLRPFLNQHLSGQLYAPALKALRSAQKHSHYTAILSSSPDFLVEPIAEILGVDAWFATHYDIDKRNCFSRISRFVGGFEKADFLKNLIEQCQISKMMTTAYSDSHHDLPMLNVVGNPVGVNPNTRLRQVCEQKGWRIL